MYLKSLTLKGFKSFAAATTLRFEPGITAVVGPNGSGKSNVVDAIAWVLGEQGAKALRGGKMEDVIFAGTAGRPPLGRAEVTLTIDNSDGGLPIGYAEVAITRRMFRDGASEYELNGRSCRLLDIQELLSDSGIGREMHVIVGQGQLDAVLAARPEDRRAFIEEAAGVLKHRRRKERAVRKLDAMQANLTRLTDLTGELRRQLKPLGRQAEVARRAVGVQADLRDARARLLADELSRLTASIARETADEQAAQSHLQRVQAELAAAQDTVRAAEAAARAATPALDAASETWFALSASAERLRGLAGLARERAGHLAQPVAAPGPGRDPDELEAAADRAETEQVRRQAAVDAAQHDLGVAEAARVAADQVLTGAERDYAAAGRAVADRREGLATLAGAVETARSRAAAGLDATERLRTSIDDARRRVEQAGAEVAALRESVGALDTSEGSLDEAHEAAAEAVAASDTRISGLTAQLAETRTRQEGLRARVEALTLGLAPRDGAGPLLAADLPGRLGALADLLEVQPGWETALAAALGVLADAVAVVDLSAAAAALRLLRDGDAGRAALLVAGSRVDEDIHPGSGATGNPTAGAAPDGHPWAIDLITAPAELTGALAVVLARVAVVPDLAAALALVTARPELRAVTRDGDAVSAVQVVGGAAAGQSTLEITKARDAAARDQAAAADRAGELAAESSATQLAAQAHRERFDATLAALHDSDAALSAVSEELGRWAATGRAAGAEADRSQRALTDATAAHQRQVSALADLEARLAAAGRYEAPAEADPGARDAARGDRATAAAAEVQVLLAVRSAQERARATAGAAEDLRRAARTERESRSRAAAAAAGRAAAARTAALVEQAAGLAVDRLARSLTEAAERRAAATARRSEVQAELGVARTAAGQLSQEWAALTDTVHRDEVLRAQQLLREQQLQERAGAEFGLTGPDLLAEFGPEVGVPPGAAEVAEYQAAREQGDPVTPPAAVPYERTAQERRARRAERDLALLGKVNPLALEEYAAQQERHAFLSTQLEDLRATRKDLLTVVGDVDEKILEVFTAAYHDVAREFGTVFATLFPGGEGALVLTDPDDMLNTGIEVHARPPGKKVKRLSLLSGGERSLTAVAMLVAIFRARPSPFYILDEVEAALDEVNLTRLVGLLGELRDSSQLLVITHQKFTMETADALYGVSMRGDGISQVISQRIRPAGAAGKVPDVPTNSQDPSRTSEPLTAVRTADSDG